MIIITESSMGFRLAVSALFIVGIGAATGCAGAADTSVAELKGADVKITINRDGCGLVDSMQYKGRRIFKARAGLGGASVTIIPAGDGTIGSLFTHAEGTVLAAKINTVRQAETKITVKGAYTGGKISIPFVREFALGEDGVVSVSERADFTVLPAEFVVTSYSLDFPMVLCKDEHLRMLALGGQHRAELFRMDQNDVKRLMQNLSDNRAYQPYWDIAGLVQLREGYRMWKANHADTRAYPLEEGKESSGWADYSEMDGGITVRVTNPAKQAPWALMIDARKGVFSVRPYPPSQPPIAGKDLGKHTFRFDLIAHETSWPAMHPCELPLKSYEALMRLIGEKGGALNSAMTGGTGTTDIKTAIYKQRYQPSTLLRLLYRYDAWRMVGVVKKVLGKTVPRNQSLDKWEELSKAVIDKIRKDAATKANKPRKQ